MAKAPTLKKSAAAIQPRPGVIVGGESAAIKQIGNSIASLADNMERRAEEAAAIEGRASGLEAGKGTSLTLDEGSGARAVAFNSAALKTFKYYQGTRISVALTEAYETNKNNPGGVERAIEGLRPELMKGVPPALRAEFEAKITRTKLIGIERSGRINEKNVFEGAKAAASTAVIDKLKQIEIDSFNVADPDHSINLAMQNIASFRELLVENGPRAGFEFDGEVFAADVGRTGAYNPVDMTRMMGQAGDRVVINQALGRFDRAPDVAEKAAVRDGLREDWQAGDLDISEEQLTRLENRMDADLRSGAVQVSAQNRAIVKDVQTATKMLTSGFPISPENVEAMKARVAASGNKDAAAALDNFKVMADFSEAIRAMPPVLLQEGINNMRAVLAKSGVQDVAQLAQLNMAEKMFSEMTTELKRDPLSWANRVGLMDIEPILLSGEGAIDTLEARVAQADAVARHYGVEPKYMTSSEMDAFKVMMDDMDPDEKLGTLMNVVSGFGDAADDVLAELGTEAPLLAYVGGLAIEGVAQAAAARSILQGSERLKENPDMQLKDIVVIPELQKAIGNALAFAPGVRANAIVGAEAMYVDAAARAGIVKFDSKLYSRSVNRALGAQYMSDGSILGGVGSYGDHQLILPGAVTQDGFDTVIANATVEDLILASVGGIPPTHGNGDPLTPKDLKTARLINYQDGTYMVDMAADGTQRIKGGVDGWYVMDFSILKQKVKIIPKPFKQAPIGFQGL